MTSDASVAFHIRFVTEKHNDLKVSLKQLVETLVGEKIDAKTSQAKDTLKRSNDLKASLSKQDYPAWLNPLIEGLNHFIGSRWKQKNLIEHLINNLDSINNHKWVFEKSENISFNFDEIYNHYKSESRLPELFDQIINILEEIRDSGEIDSLLMMNALAKVISTLKSNKNGSYFSLNSAWSFLLSFLKNYMWAEISNIPVLGSALEALEKTLNETNEEMESLHSKIKSKLKDVVESEVKGLSQKTSFDFISYDSKGTSLPTIESKSTITEV